eukprot:461742-Alexandrium_andersonii.AAC.1
MKLSGLTQSEHSPAAQAWLVFGQTLSRARVHLSPRACLPCSCARRALIPRRGTRAFTAPPARSARPALRKFQRVVGSSTPARGGGAARPEPRSSGVPGRARSGAA